MPRKRVAIVQSSYIPWKGYFDLIRAADEFILLDDVQFTKRDWRTRNRIKTKDGPTWLTIPVHTKGRFEQRIQEVTISDPDWGRRHWNTIRSSYARTPFFADVAPRVERLFLDPGTNSLSATNHGFIRTICDALGIVTPIRWSTDYEARHGRNQRLIDLCLAAGATEYLSGPAARGYIDDETWRSAGINVHFADYSNYPEYPQPHPPFDHAVTVLDLMFCTGPRALDYMKDLSPAPAGA
jgi:hypothetical protein